MRHTRSLFAVTIVMGQIVAVAAKAGMLDKDGMEPWEVCGLCHSLNGISQMAKFPKLAGQKSAYIEKQFRDFHSEKRMNDGGQMSAITTEVDMDTLPAIAEYFEALPPPPEAKDYLEGYGEAAALFENGRGEIPSCVSCHGSNPQETSYEAPWLSAQHADYLSKQLTDFKEKRRTNDPDGIMQRIAEGLTGKEIESLAQFLASKERGSE